MRKMTYLLLAIHTTVICNQCEELLPRETEAVGLRLVGVRERSDGSFLLVHR